MTDQVILTQTERVIEQSEAGTVVQRVDAGTIVVTGMIGPPGVANITDASDLDKTNLQDGSVLVYQASNTKWIATKDLVKQNIDGGSY